MPRHRPERASSQGCPGNRVKDAPTSWSDRYGRRVTARIGVVLGIALATMVLDRAGTLEPPARAAPSPPAHASRCSTFIISRDDQYFWGMGYAYSARNVGCVTARRVLRRVDDRLFVTRDVPSSSYGNYDSAGASRYGAPFVAGRFTCRYTRLGSDIGKGYCTRGRRKIAWRVHVLKG